MGREGQREIRGTLKRKGMEKMGHEKMEWIGYYRY